VGKVGLIGSGKTKKRIRQKKIPVAADSENEADQNGVRSRRKKAIRHLESGKVDFWENEGCTPHPPPHFPQNPQD